MLGDVDDLEVHEYAAEQVPGTSRRSDALDDDLG